MYCSYHTSTGARVQCSSCGRPLCHACDHRIKGYPYCQDCIVLGVERLHRVSDEGRSKRRGRIAALFALLPGMGAVYNRQNIKAVVHFVSIVGLFEMASLKVIPGVFALGGIVYYLYSIVDAYRTAILISRGESPAADEQRFKRSLIKRAPIIGLVLISVGLMLVVQLVRPFAFIAVARLFPVALIILGGYLLTRYFKRSSEESYEPHSSSPPYSLIPGRFGEKTSDGSRFSNSASRR
jgi:hypothetical protein